MTISESGNETVWRETLNSVQEPQLLPLSYAMPLVTARFASPVASVHLPQSLLGLFSGRKAK